jgi:hypothetical protein
MLMFGLRLGDDPRVMVTTTPRPTKLIKDLVADPTVAISRGSTYENRANLAGAFLQQIVKKYEGTRLGRPQRPWPADKVERWAIDRLIPYAKNARTHTDAQVAAIAASIKEWGWTTPALVGEDGGLIAGHARILAARQLGIAEIPVMVAAGWSEAQKRAYVLADAAMPSRSTRAISGSRDHTRSARAAAIWGTGASVRPCTPAA